MEQQVAILMADLTGYTAMTDAHGGASAAQLINKYMRLVDASLYGTCKVVQRIGDQVVIIATVPEDILMTGKKINALTSSEAEFLAIHAGIHFGNVFIDNDNLFGSTINIASRIMNVANREQILCSKHFVEQIADKSIFEAAGFHKLKNVREKIEVFELTLSSLPTPLTIDPVCHMHIEMNKAGHDYTYNEVTYYFCSAHCMTLFQQGPASFLS